MNMAEHIPEEELEDERASKPHKLATLHVMNIINGSLNLNLIIDESAESLTYHHPLLRLNRIDGEDKYHINVIGNTFEIGLLLVRYGATKSQGFDPNFKSIITGEPLWKRED
jgi:hypothetical protein